MSIKLDPCLELIINESKKDDAIVQVIEVPKPSEDPLAPKKITISDGAHFITVILNNYTYEFFGDKIQNFQLIKIQYQVTQISTIIITNIEILPIKVDGLIGKPTQIKVETTSQTKAGYFTIRQLVPSVVSFKIIARVGAKSSPRDWHNGHFKTTYFSITLIDASGLIIGIFLNSNERLYNKIEQNKVYEIQNFKVNPKKHLDKHFKNINNSEFEIVFTEHSSFVPVDDDGSIPTISFDYTPIKNIKNKESSSTVDVMAIVVDVGEVISVKKKDGTQLKKQALILTDESEATINFILWNDDTGKISLNSNDHVIQLIESRVSEYLGLKELTIGKMTNFEMVNDLAKEPMRLLKWWKTNKSRVGNFDHISSPDFQLITIRQIADKTLGVRVNNPVYFSCYVTINRLYQSGYYYHFNEDNNNNNSQSDQFSQSFPFSQSSQPSKPGGILYIHGCPTCENKMQLSEGQYICPKCKKRTNNPKILYEFDTKLSDDSGETVFRVYHSNQKIGELVLGVKAEEWKNRTEKLTFSERTEMIEERTKGRSFKVYCKADCRSDSDLINLIIERIEENDSNIEEPQL